MRDSSPGAALALFVLAIYLIYGVPMLRFLFRASPTFRSDRTAERQLDAKLRERMLRASTGANLHQNFGGQRESGRHGPDREGSGGAD
jgi:hypothetical protein